MKSRRPASIAPVKALPLPKRRNKKFADGFAETEDSEALYYRIYGKSGPLMVLCDGVGCEGYIWKYLIQDLSKNFRLLHWQYRGHGRSSPCRSEEDFGKLTILQMARDMHAVLQAAAPGEEAIFLGHSMGVQVILEFHREFSAAKVRALVPICGAAGNTLDTFMESLVLKQMFPFILGFFRLAPKFSHLLWNKLIANPLGYYPAVLLQLTSTLCAKEDLRPYLEHLGRMDARVFMELAHEMGRHTAEDHLAEIDVPTLVFAATRDRFTPVERSRQIADHISNSELCLIRGGTHTAPLEMPELMTLRLRKFLSEHGIE